MSLSARQRFLHFALALMAVSLAGAAVRSAYQQWTRPEILASSPASAKPDNPIPALSWSDLRGYNYRSQQASELLDQHQGKSVRIPGFMIPLEDDVASAVEFLLVPFVGACIHTPPPPPNQIVRVAMIRNQGVRMNLWDPVWVTGTFEIGKSTTQFGDVSFQLVGTAVEPYQ